MPACSDDYPCEIVRADQRCGQCCIIVPGCAVRTEQFAEHNKHSSLHFTILHSKNECVCISCCRWFGRRLLSSPVCQEGICQRLARSPLFDYTTCPAQCCRHLCASERKWQSSKNTRNEEWHSSIFLNSDAFLAATRLSVIIVNALWIAVDTDYNDQDLLIYARPEFQIMETLS